MTRPRYIQFNDLRMRGTYSAHLNFHACSYIVQSRQHMHGSLSYICMKHDLNINNQPLLQIRTQIMESRCMDLFGAYWLYYWQAVLCKTCRTHCIQVLLSTIAGDEATKQWYDEISKYNFRTASGPGTGKLHTFTHIQWHITMWIAILIVQMLRVIFWRAIQNACRYNMHVMRFTTLWD